MEISWTAVGVSHGCLLKPLASYDIVPSGKTPENFSSLDSTFVIEMHDAGSASNTEVVRTQKCCKTDN